LLAAAVWLGGCGLVSGIFVAASVAGVEYTLANVAYKVIPEANGEVRTAVDRALVRLTLPVERGWAKDEDGQVILARAKEHEVEVRIEEVSRRATRLRVDARRVGIPFLKDRALAAAVIVETERELGMIR